MDRRRVLVGGRRARGQRTRRGARGPRRLRGRVQTPTRRCLVCGQSRRGQAMGIDLANGPVSWGVDRPDMPGAPPWQEVFDEISEAGYRLCELGPLGYLPDDNQQVRVELDARGLGVAGSYIFEPLHDRGRHEEIADV